MKKYNVFEKFTASICVGLMTVFTLFATVPMRALDIQTLNVDQRAASGFTHAARVTWDDLNNADQSALVVQLFQIPTNTYIDRVGWYVEETFTNASFVATGGATNLVLTVGVGGTTNAFFGSNTLIHANASLSTNMLIAYKATTSTNYLIACFSDGLQANNVDGYLVGKIRIYWRLNDLNKIRF